MRYMILILTPFTAHAEGLEIHRATYTTHKEACEATELVKTICDGKVKCSIDVTEAICETPLKGAGKLTVFYTCNGTGGSIAKLERQTIEIDCEKPL